MKKKREEEEKEKYIFYVGKSYKDFFLRSLGEELSFKNSKFLFL